MDFEFKEVTTYAGPIHEFQWTPNSTHFIVISGFMPAHSVLYKKDGTPQYKYGAHHRNKLFWAPSGKYFAIAGFENLKGEIDIWDFKKKKIVGSCTSSQSSFLKWCPDSMHFLTAIVEKTLKLGNCFKVVFSVGLLIERFLIFKGSRCLSRILAINFCTT